MLMDKIKNRDDFDLNQTIRYHVIVIYFEQEIHWGFTHSLL